MWETLDFIRSLTRLAIVLRVSIAVVCGGAIGIERETKHRAAGFRTHILICMGAAIAMLNSQYLYLVAGYHTDIARLGAQVIAGIGFIGAGAIIVTRQNRIRGLTTAAGLWCSAIIGLACGAGYVECALLATGIILFAELVLIKIEKVFVNSTGESRYYIEYAQAEDLRRCLAFITGGGVKISDLEIGRKEAAGPFTAVLTLKPTAKAARNHVVEKAFDNNGISTVEWL